MAKLQEDELEKNRQAQSDFQAAIKTRRMLEINRINKNAYNRKLGLALLCLGIILLVTGYLYRTKGLVEIIYLINEYFVFLVGAILIVFSLGIYIKNSPRIADIDFLSRSKEKQTKGTTADPQASWPFPPSGARQEFEEPEDETFLSALEQMTDILRVQASISDEKASALLDKGIAYAGAGILFFLISIIFWQVFFHFYGFKYHHLAGIISCGTLFLAVEIISAWFLKQYRNFIDNSTELIKIKAIFDKYLLLKLASDGIDETNSLDMQLAELLSRDITWPEPARTKSNTVGMDLKIVEQLIVLAQKMAKTSQSGETGGK